MCSNVVHDIDCISSADFSDAMGYLNFHYQVAHRNNKASGFHDDFAKFVGNHDLIIIFKIGWDVKNTTFYKKKNEKLGYIEKRE